MEIKNLQFFKDKQIQNYEFKNGKYIVDTNNGKYLVEIYEGDLESFLSLIREKKFDSQ